MADSHEETAHHAPRPGTGDERVRHGRLIAGALSLLGLTLIGR